MTKNPYDPKSYPIWITIMPQSDVRMKSKVKVNSLEQIQEYQRMRFEISYD